jgi:sensor histidine kinase YesM
MSIYKHHAKKNSNLLSTCPSVHPSIHSSIRCLSIYLPISISIYLSLSLSISRSISLPICLSIFLSPVCIYLCTYLCMYSYPYLLTHQFCLHILIYRPVYLSFRLYMYRVVKIVQPVQRKIRTVLARTLPTSIRTRSAINKTIGQQIKNKIDPNHRRCRKCPLLQLPTHSFHLYIMFTFTS